MWLPHLFAWTVLISLFLDWVIVQPFTNTVELTAVSQTSEVLQCSNG